MNSKQKGIICVLLLFACIIIWGSVILYDGHSKDEAEQNVELDTTLNTVKLPPSQQESMEITTDLSTELPTELPTLPEEKEVTVSVVMIGDMLLHNSVQKTGKKEDGSYNYDHLFTYIKDNISSADIAVANQEVIIGGARFGIRDYPRFNCREEVGDALVNAGFDVILHGTNHAMDWGEEAVDACINFWEDSHPQIAYLGIHSTKEDSEEIYVYEKDGFKIAMLNYTYGTNGIKLPEDRKYLVDILDKEKVKADILKAEEMADFVIVYPHWGSEYVYEPSESQKIYAQLFADCGADLVIGTHPHVIQPVEWITGVNGNKTLVYYSLGNYISAQDAAPRMLGAMAEVEIKKDKEGNVWISDYGVVPLVTHFSWGTNYTTYKLSQYTEQLVANNSILKYDETFSIDMMKNLCSQIFGELYIE